MLRLTGSDGQLSSSDQVTITVADQPTSSAGLVGHWSFDSSNPTTDSSGQNNQGTLNGSPSIVDGPNGNALNFNSKSDYLEVADSSSLDVSDEITISAWIRPESRATQYVIKKADRNQTDGFELSLSSSGRVFVRFNGDSSGNDFRLDSTSRYPTDGSTWMHVAATYDGSTIRLYINGELEASQSASFQIATNDLPLAIGAGHNGDRGYVGAMDDVRIYSQAISQQEIDAIITGQPTPNVAPTVSAGSDQVIDQGTVVQLAGSAADDGGPNPLATTWTKISGTGTVTFGNAAAAQTTATFSSAGRYVLRLTATDGELQSHDDIIVDVNAAILNTPPTVSAGANQTINEGQVVVLTGSATDDGLPGPLNFSWSQASGPGSVSFANSSASSTTATFTAPGTYVLRLTASDGDLSNFDELTVVVVAAPVNGIPSVNAGANQTIDEGQAASLAGVASDDGQPAPLSLAWTKVSGQGNVAFANAATASTTATFTAPGVYVLRLTATDGEYTRFDELTVTVNAAPVNEAPVVSVGGNRTIALGETTNLVGLVSDDGLTGSLSTQWTRVSGPNAVSFANASAATTTASFAAAGTYVLRLTASDGEFTAFDQLTVTVVEVSSEVTLSFQNGVDGYNGTRDTTISGDDASTNFGDENAMELDGDPQVSALLAWDLSSIASGSMVTAAWVDLTITNTSSDVYGVFALECAWDELSATWEQASNTSDWGTQGAAATSDRDTTLVGELRATSKGSYRLDLNQVGLDLVQTWVDDPASNHGLIFQDYDNASNGVDFASSEASSVGDRPQLTVTVQSGGPIDPVNLPPVTSAGSNQQTTVGTPVALSGVVSDDGLPGSVTASWSRVSGPNAVSFANANSASTTAQFSQAGTYVLRLTGSDGQLSSSDQVTIVVNDVVVNAPPVTSAGSNQQTTVGTAVVLSGTVTDDGLPGPTTASWSRVSGPNAVSFANANSASTTAQFSQAGTYVLRLTASDGQLSSSDQVTIVVNDVVVNTPPVTSAGSNQQTTVGTPVVLSGTITDDGLPGPTTASWSRVSGPNAVSFGNANSVSTTAQFSQAGTYVLRLTGSDGQLSSSDQVTITVADQPTSSAGLVGHWSFDGSNPTTDSSGQNNQGTLNGSPSIVDGPNGNALNFNSKSDYLEVADSSSLDVSDEITISAWIRPESRATQYVIKKADRNQTDGFELSLSSSGRVFVRFNGDSSGNDFRLDSTSRYPTDGSTWMHVAATYDGSTIRLYINGELEASQSASFQIATNDLPLAIGAGHNGDRGYVGAMDDVRIYSQAISQQEILNLYNV